MKKILLDLRPFDSKAAVHTYLKEALGLPSYYGANFDALHDCLTDIQEDTCLGVFEPQTDSPAESLPASGSSLPEAWFTLLNRVLRDSEKDNPHLAVIFSRYEDNR